MSLEYAKPRQAALIGYAVSGLTALVALIVGVVLLTQPFSDEEPTNAEPAPACPTTTLKPGEKLASTSVRVNVFNGSARDGLAAETLEALSERGFQAGETANASSELVVKRVKVYATSDEAAAGRLVAAQFGARTDIKPGPDLAPGIDVVLGPEYQGLAKAPRAIALSAPTQVCADSAG